MMKKKVNVLICGHTGSSNRGCEAIMKSTYLILDKTGYLPKAMSFDIPNDKKAGLDQKMELIPYPQNKRVEIYIEMVLRKFNNADCWNSRILYNEILDQYKETEITFNVGGDTYCYGHAHHAYALNMVTTKRGIKNIFWGCSIPEDLLNNKAMIKDINRYDAIVTRESISYDILKKVYKNKDNLFLTCDPAFNLETKEIELPTNFVVNNTVGINVSGYVCKNENDDNDITYQNIKELIDYILENTDMNICLIPHDYEYESKNGDYYNCKKIYGWYENERRVTILDGDYNCEEIKYAISKCRFFVGAKTHSTIAAYSSCIPTIALSYSVKSRGLAKDLFGTEVGYAMSYNEIKTKTELKDNFINLLLKREEEIKKHYSEMMPSYKESIIKAAEKIKEMIYAQ